MTKKKKKPRQNSEITIYLESLPGGKRLSGEKKKKEKANLVTPIEKNQDIRNQLVKRTKTHRKMLQCYNYKECSILGRAKLQKIDSWVGTILQQFRLKRLLRVSNSDPEISRIVPNHELSCIYIYIYCHPQSDCFVVSQLFSVARHVRRFKRTMYLAQIFVRLSMLPLSHQSTYVSSGIKRHYVLVFVCLHFPYRIPECSIISKTFVLRKWQPLIPSPECSTLGEWSVYIVIHRQFRCITTLQCG